jgi:hypothetical protein
MTTTAIAKGIVTVAGLYIYTRPLSVAQRSGQVWQAAHNTKVRLERV